MPFVPGHYVLDGYTKVYIGRWRDNLHYIRLPQTEVLCDVDVRAMRVTYTINDEEFSASIAPAA